MRRPLLLSMALASLLAAGCATVPKASLYDQFGGRPGIEALVEELLARGVTPVMAGRRAEWQRWREARGIAEMPQVLHFTTLRDAQRAFEAQNKRPGEEPGPM